MWHGTKILSECIGNLPENPFWQGFQREKTGQPQNLPLECTEKVFINIASKS
jgi:hypothetical protein